MKLTAKQQLFCNYYLQSLNATDAARKAGYSEKYINTNASKLLQNTTIKSYLDVRLNKRHDDAIASADEVLCYLSSVLRGEEKEEVVVTTATDFELIEKALSHKDRMKAAELLGKRYALYTDKQDITAEHKVVIIDDI